MKLYWHKWVTRHGTLYHLHDTPFDGNTESRRLSGEIAVVSRVNGGWNYAIHQPTETVAGTWGLTGSPVSSRRVVEVWLGQKSGAIWGEDTVEFFDVGHREAVTA